MKQMYKEATSELTRIQKAIIVATLIFIGICSAALFVAIIAEVIRQL